MGFNLPANLRARVRTHMAPSNPLLPTPTKPPRRNNGKAFESLIYKSSGRVILLERLPASGSKCIGPGKFINQPVCCDFAGTVIGTGRAFFADAKSNKEPKRFPMGNWTKVHDHQRAFLVAQGKAGALSGLLVESSASGDVYWLDWKHLDGREPSILWTDERLVRLGTNRVLIDFSGIVKGAP